MDEGERDGREATNVPILGVASIIDAKRGSTPPAAAGAIIIDVLC